MTTAAEAALAVERSHKLVHCFGCPCMSVCEAEGRCRAKPEDRHPVKRDLPPNPKQAYGDLKVPLGLVPSTSIIYEAQAFGEGARKYGPFNWREKAVEAMTYLHASLRHIYAVIDGEWIDPETGDKQIPHLGLAKACLGIVADAFEHDFLIDNRPTGKAGEMLRARTKAQKVA